MILHSKNLELVFNILGMKTEIHANFIDENNILAISIWVSKGVVLECLTLLKSLLSSLPTYLSLFTILTFVTKDWRLQKKNCGCGASDEFKFFLVDRNIVCAPIENQSMGLKLYSDPQVNGYDDMELKVLVSGGKLLAWKYGDDWDQWST